MLGSDNNKKILTSDDNFTIQGNYSFNKNVVSAPPSNNSHLANKGYVDGRISALSAQIAELSKKIETVSSSSGGSNWVAELAGISELSKNALTTNGQGLEYTSKIKVKVAYLNSGAKFVNPTNRDCVILAMFVGSNSGDYPGTLVSSSHGTAKFWYGEDNYIMMKTASACVQLLKGAHLSYSGGPTLILLYILVES